jgi:hypothetical protein
MVAASYGIDLREAIARKFNATSDKVGLPHRLTVEPRPMAEQELTPDRAEIAHQKLLAEDYRTNCPSTGKPHDFWRVGDTAFPAEYLPPPRERQGLIFSGPATRTEGGISVPLAGPMLLATGLFTGEQQALERAVRILNMHWENPMFDALEPATNG